MVQNCLKFSFNHFFRYIFKILALRFRDYFFSKIIMNLISVGLELPDYIADREDILSEIKKQ